MSQRYRYQGDRLTAPELKNQPCTAVHNQRGKCIRGRNGSMMVYFPHLNQNHIIIGRLLRKSVD